MRYSASEAAEITRQLKKCSINELDILFNTKVFPEFEELRGDTKGVILALNPENPPWLKSVIRVVFHSPLGKWTGKRFITPFNKKRRGYGINLFKSKYFPQLFKFDTYIKDAYLDGKPCLALDYRPYHSFTYGLVDEVRKFKEGQFLGRAYFRIPLKEQMWFAGYFALCPLRFLEKD